MKLLLFFILIPVTIYSQVYITPSFINFGEVNIGSKKDTTIIIESVEGIEIESFDFKFGSDSYTINETFPIDITAGQQKTISISYQPIDSVKSYTEYSFKAGSENISISLLGGYKYQDTIIEATKITGPAKDDYYLYKDEIIINWTKVPGFDRYIIQFSANNGGNWSTITDSAVGTSYTWKAPHLNSDKCLIRIESYFEPENKFFKFEWDKPIGISKNDDSNKLIQTSDGGYLTVGLTRGKDSSSSKKLFNDILVCKMDKDGEQLWTKTYGGKEGEDVINSVIESDDKHYMLIGKTNSGDFEENLKGDYDLLLMKIDEQGNLVWKKNYGGSKYDIGIDIDKDKEGNFYLGGYTGSIDGDIISTNGWADYWALKVNSNGEIIWTNTYGRDKDELLTDMQLSMDGGLILYGSSNSVDSIPVVDKGNGFKDKDHAWVVKADRNGQQLWDYQYEHETDNPYNLIENNEGEIIINGYSVIYKIPYIERYTWLCKLSNGGQLIWYNRFRESDEYPMGMELDKNGNIYLIADVYAGDPIHYILMTKYSKVGNKLWSKRITSIRGIGGATKTYDNGFAVISKNPVSEIDKKNMLLVKISNEQLYEIGYSDLFEIASSKPYFSIDEVVFDTTYKGEVRDTIIRNILCNDGVVQIDITNTKFIIDYTEFRLDSVYSDGILEQGECLDMKFSFSTELNNRRQSYIYAVYPFGKSTDRIDFKSFIVDKKLENKVDWFRFGQVYVGQEVEKKYINLRNYSQYPIKVNLEHNYSSTNNIILNNGQSEFYIEGESYYEVPIEYKAKVEKKDTMTLRIYYDDTVSINPVYILAEAIFDPNTSVTNYNMSSSSLDISPNPASEQLNIDVSTGVQGTMTLELVATDGRVIYTDEWIQSTKTKQMQINTLAIPSGLYQVRLITPYDAITKSVVVVE